MTGRGLPLKCSLSMFLHVSSWKNGDVHSPLAGPGRRGERAALDILVQGLDLGVQGLGSKEFKVWGLGFGGEGASQGQEHLETESCQLSLGAQREGTHPQR